MKVKETDFMSELDAATGLRPAMPAVILLTTIFGFVFCFFAWASLAQIEEITRGAGQVVPSQDLQIVQSLEGGVLQEILVQEGQLVKKGQPLLRISDVQFASEERGTEARYLGLTLKKFRLEAEVRGTDFVVPSSVRQKAPKIVENEIALYKSRQRELQTQYDILDRNIEQAEADLEEVKATIKAQYQSRKLLLEEFRITQDMVRKRAVPKMEEIRVNRELSDVTGQINSNTQRKASLEAQVKSAKKERSGQRDKFRSKSLSELNEVETELSSLQESLKSMGDRVDRAELRSPVDGIVNAMALNTIGGVVEPAMRLIEIVPVDDELKITAKVSPDQIAFIKPDQDAKVKISAYDPQKYGALEGKLVRISANSITDQEGNVFFEIEVRTDKNYLGTEDVPLSITPGMQAEVEILTGKRTILEYLLKPLLRARDRALTER